MKEGQCSIFGTFELENKTEIPHFYFDVVIIEHITNPVT